MRIIACYFVIFNHTEGFTFYAHANGIISYYLSAILSVFAKISVPLFLAISGALLLGREEAIHTIIKKRISRIFGALLLFSFLYYLSCVVLGETTFDIKLFFFNLLTSTVNGSYWYLFSYLAFLFSLPLLTVFVRAMSNYLILYMMILAMLSYAIIPIISFWIWKGNGVINSDFRVYWITHIIVMYPVIGYYIHNRCNVNKISAGKLFVLWAINIASMFLIAYTTKLQNSYTGGYTQDFLNYFNLINVASVFITAKYAFYHCVINERLKRFISKVGSSTWGIYLLHLFILKRKPFIDIYNHMRDSVSLVPADLVYCLFIMFFLCIIVILLKNIPYINKLL